MSGVVAILLLMTGAPGMAKCAVAPASAMAMSTAILIFAVFMSAWGPSSIPLVTFVHVIALDGNGVLLGLTSKMGRSCERLLALTFISLSSRFYCLHWVGVVIAVIFKQILLL